MSSAAVCRHEKIDLAAHEVLSLFNVLRDAPARAIFERNCATLDVTQFQEPLSEDAGASVRLRVEDSDVGDMRCLLRLSGERRGEWADGEKEGEPDQPHGAPSITPLLSSSNFE